VHRCPFHPFSSILHPFVRWALPTILLLAGAFPALAQRPTAIEIMPHSTLAVVRIADLPLMAERFKQTALGRVAQDSRMKPLVGDLYKAAQDAFKQIEGQVGLPLDQLLKIPQGEVAVGFVATTDFEQEPGFIALIDTKDQATQARKLLIAAEQIAQRNGGTHTTEKFGAEEVDVYTGFGKARIFSIERDGAFIFATNKELMTTVLANLNGGGVEKTLADNDKYSTLISRCSTSGEEPPQISWYADPIALVRRLASGSLATVGLSLFPVLGLDGLHAVGGTITFASGEFDEVQHIHVLLDNPRVGVIDAVALSSGDMTPESWVPGDCVSYATIHWDLRHTFNVSASLFNSIMGEGELERQIRTRVSDQLGVDIEKDVMPQLTGRATHIQWVEKPVRLNSMTTIVGIQLKDPQAFKPIVEKAIQRQGGRLERQRYGNTEYWSSKNPLNPGRRGKNGPELRQQLPCVGIVNDYLILTDSLKAFQEVVSTQMNPDNSLTSSLDFKLISSKIKRQPGGDAPGAISFARPEEGMRFWYDMALAEDTQKRLTQQAERNRFFGSLNQALKDHPLPPFSVISEYMAPAGGMLVNDQTGIHYMTFTLKRQ
jgi:hypothetical protein